MCRARGLGAHTLAALAAAIAHNLKLAKSDPFADDAHESEDNNGDEGHTSRDIDTGEHDNNGPTDQADADIPPSLATDNGDENTPPTAALTLAEHPLKPNSRTPRGGVLATTSDLGDLAPRGGTFTS